MNRDGMSDTFAKYEKLLHGVREVLDKEQHEKWAAQEKLKEARAEIERLKAEVDRWRKESLAKDDARLNLQSAADSIKYWTKQAFDKDKLIEQMRSALAWLYNWTKAEIEHFGACPPDDEIIRDTEAALEAAERGER